MKLTKAQLKQVIEEVLAEDLNEVTAGEEVDWLKMLGDELQQLSDKPLSKEMEDRIINAYDLKDLYDKIKDIKEPEYDNEVDAGWSAERLTSPDVPDSRGPGASAPRGTAKKSHVSRVPRRPVPKQNTRLAGVSEQKKEHTMKLNKDTLAQMIKEELEVILTDEEAVEMFGLEENVMDEGCGSAYKRDDEEPLEEVDVTYVAKMLLNGLLALQNAGVHPGAIIDALRGAGDRERQAMAELPGFAELAPEVQQQVAGGAALEEAADEDEDVDLNTGTRTEKPKGKFKTSYGHMKENNLFMTRDKLAEMIREEMARTTMHKNEND